MYWMRSAACSTPKVRNAPKCSEVMTALKPTTGMLAASPNHLPLMLTAAIMQGSMVPRGEEEGRVLSDQGRLAGGQALPVHVGQTHAHIAERNIREYTCFAKHRGQVHHINQILTN